MELTPIGREIADRARRILVDVRDIRDLAERASEHFVGTLRFGVSPTLGPYLMPAIIAALHREQPDLRLHIREGFPHRQAQALSRGSLDMLLAPLPIDGRDLEVEPLFSEPLFMLAAPDHPLANLRTVRKSDLKHAPVLSIDPGHPLHDRTVAICTKLGMQLLRDYEGSSLDSVRQMVGSGIGLAILPQLYILSEVGERSEVKVLKIAGWRETRSIGAAWRTSAAYRDAYRLIAERIRSEALQLIG